eukprot:6261786-Amphidinium_carterae.3
MHQQHDQLRALDQGKWYDAQPVSLKDGSPEGSTPGRAGDTRRSTTPPPPPTTTPPRSSAADATVNVLDKLDQILEEQQEFKRRFVALEGNVQQHSSRITRLERLSPTVDALTSKVDGLVLGQDKRRSCSARLMLCRWNAAPLWAVQEHEPSAHLPAVSWTSLHALWWCQAGWKSPKAESTWNSGCARRWNWRAHTQWLCLSSSTRVVFTSASEATEKHSLFREKKPMDKKCKIFVNRAQTADKHKGDFILRRCRDSSLELAPTLQRENIRLSYGSKVIYYQMRVVAFLRGNSINKGDGWNQAWDWEQCASPTQSVRCL